MEKNKLKSMSKIIDFIKNVRTVLSKNMHLVMMIALVIVSLFFLTFTGIKYYKSYKEEKAALLYREQQAENDRQLELAAKESLRNEEIQSLKQQLTDLQNKLSGSQKTQSNNTTVYMSPPTDTTAAIVKKWSPRMAHIECYWYDQNDELFAKGSGSGTLVDFTNLGIRAITNKHLLVYKDTLPRDCNIELLDGNNYKVAISRDNVSIGTNEDWAYITLTRDKVLTDLTKNGIKTCKSVDIGDQLLVLGYPKIGSKTGITVTEGIVSGNDKDYYITSAKIDKGNSGGAAILTRSDCYLGIPSSSAIGSIESLGRILKSSFVIEG